MFIDNEIKYTGKVKIRDFTFTENVSESVLVSSGVNCLHSCWYAAVF